MECFDPMYKGVRLMFHAHFEGTEEYTAAIDLTFKNAPLIKNMTHEPPRLDSQ